MSTKTQHEEEHEEQQENRFHAKNWKQYFLEFIMLFLAISLGFFADNYREKRSDKTKEREYILSMIEDAEEDRINIKEVLSRNTQRSKYLDTLANLCFNYSTTNNQKDKLYQYFPIVLFHPHFIAPTELTMQQLKNAGGMRMIKNKNAIDEIIRYDSKIKKLENQQVYYENYHNNSINIGTKIFTLQNLLSNLSSNERADVPNEFKFVNDDKQLLTEFANTVSMYKGCLLYTSPSPRDS